MNPLDRLKVIYELDDTRFIAGINRMRGAGDRFAREAVGFGSRAEGAFGGVSRSALAAAASVAGLGVALNKMRTATDAFKTIENQLRSIGQSSDEATDKLLSSAIRSRASIEELSTGVARIQKATGDGYDVTLRRVETLNKLLSVGGATAQEVSSVMVQISQAFTSGELMGEELRALREAAPVELLDAIAEAAGGTRAELKKFGEEGKLTNEVVTRALDNLKETADRRFGDTTQTIGQAMTNINNALVVFVGRVDEGTGASETLVSALTNLSEWLVDNADEAVQLGQSLGAMFDVAKGEVYAFIGQIDGIAEALRDALGTEPFDDFGSGVDRAMGFIAKLDGMITGAADVTREAFLVMADAIAAGIAGSFNFLKNSLETFINDMLVSLRGLAAVYDLMNPVNAVTTGGLSALVRGNVSLGGDINPGDPKASGRSFSDIYSDSSTSREREILAAQVARQEAVADSYNASLARRQIASQTPLQLGLPPVAAPIASGGGGGGGGGSSDDKGAKGKTEKAESPFFGDIEKDLLNLERQIALVGKSNEEVATAKARWELLDEAKKRGIPVNAELSAQIDAQAEQFGRLTGELERAEKSQQQFEQAVDGIADAMAGALVAGESLRDGLAQVLKGIASDILTSGIRSALQGQFGGFGGGGFNFMSLFGGGDNLTGALRGAGLPAFDGGGFTGSGSRSGGVDGKGGFPAILHPNETVVDHTKGQAGGTSVLMVELSPELEARILSAAKGQSIEISQQTAAAQAKALPAQVQRVQANPRRR